MKKLLIIAIVFAAFGLATGWCHLAFASDASDLNATLTRLAGSTSKDCGTVPLPADSTSAIACAKSAIKEGNSFRLSLQGQGTDSTIWLGVAQNADGKVWTAIWDSDPSGGSHVGAVVRTNECKKLAWTDRYFHCVEPESMP